MPGSRRLDYVLKNVDPVPHCYVGLTADVSTRLSQHNAGHCPHTPGYCPWELHVVIEFRDEPTAVRFERYLKSGSGRAFAKRHFEPGRLDVR
jgi:putative endonuclease